MNSLANYSFHSTWKVFHMTEIQMGDSYLRGKYLEWFLSMQIYTKGILQLKNKHFRSLIFEN